MGIRRGGSSGFPSIYASVCATLQILATLLVAAGSAHGQVTSFSDAAVTILGEQSQVGFGECAAGAGDVDGDGFDDYLIGAPFTTTSNGSFSGRAYLIYGSDAAPPIEVDSATPVTGQFTAFDGAGSVHQAGFSVAGIPDFDGDGLADFAITAPGASHTGGRTDAGYVYLLSGAIDWAKSDTFDLADFGSEHGSLIIGKKFTNLGLTIASAGDFNGDGLSDLVIGAGERAYVVFGSATFPAQLDLAGLPGGQFIELSGFGGNIGRRVAGIGDVNGDGYSDVVIAAPQMDQSGVGVDTGAVFVVFGEASPPASVNLLQHATADVVILKIVGAAAHDELGNTVAGAGDFDDDGYPDFLIGAAQASRGVGSHVGEAYLILGSATLASVADGYCDASSDDDDDDDDDGGSGGECRVLDISDLGSLGITFRGTDAGDKVGRSVAGIGDFDNDGIDDIVITASGIVLEDLPEAGSGGAYLIPGGQSLDSFVTGSDLEDASHLYIAIGPFDVGGWFVAGTGDINNDGAADFITSAIFADRPGINNSGEAYVFLGDGLPSVHDLSCSADGTRVLLEWTIPKKAGYDQIEIFEGAALIATLSGVTTEHTIRRVAAGSHTYRVTATKDDASRSAECSVLVTVAPPALMECSSDGTAIELTWANGQTYSGSVNVYRGGLLVTTLAGGSESYSEALPEPGVYSYCVSGVNGTDESAQTCCTVTVPVQVASLECLVDGDSVQLSWTNSALYDSLLIFRDGTFIAERPGTATSFSEVGVLPGTHVYTVQSVIGEDLSQEVACEAFVASPVENLVCSAVDGTASISWVVGGIYESVHVYRNGTEIAVLAGGATSYEDAPLAAGEYEYSVAGEQSGTLSVEVSCGVLVIEPVTGLACSAVDDDVTLAWSIPAGATYTSIVIWREGAEIATLAGAVSNYSDPDLATGEYTYQVVAHVAGGFTSSATAECTLVVLEAPAGLVCAAFGTTIELSWTGDSAYSSIEISRDGVLVATLPGGSTSYSDPTTAGSHSYEVVGIAGGSSSAPATCEIASAGDPSALTCSVDGDLATLSWLNGDAYETISIILDGLVVAELAGATEATTLTVSDPGAHTVCVRGVVGLSTSNPTCCGIEVVAPVVDLTCSAVGDTIFIRWTNGGTYDGIEVLRDGAPVASLPGTATQFVDPEVAAGFHDYEVRARAGGDLSVGVTCEATTIDDIEGLTCSSDEGVVTIGFTPPAGLELIKIQRNGLLVAILAGDTTEYEESSISAGLYVYEVTGFSDYGATETVACTVRIPLPPFGLVCDVEGGVTTNLNWINAELADSIEVSRDGVLLASLPGTTSTYSDGPLAAGAYVYSVASVIDGNGSVHAVCEVIVLAAPTELLCLAIDGGVFLTWNDGDDYGSVTIRRDGAVIASVAPGLGAYFDAFAGPGIHAYEISGFLAGFESARVECGVEVPLGVLDLTCAYEGSSGELTWTNQDAYTSIRIYRNGVLLDTIAGSATSYLDPILPAGHYEYEVIAVLDGHDSAGAACEIDVLLRPDDFVCVVDGATALLAWVNGEDYDFVHVFRDGVLIATLDGGESSFSDSVESPMEVLYCVRGVTADSSSSLACCEARVVGAPVGLDCVVDGVNASLSWTNGEEYDFIQIWRSGTLVVTLAGDATTFLAVGLEAGAHTFEVVGHVGIDASVGAICEVFVTASVTGLACSVVGDAATLEWTLGSGSYDQIEVRLDGALIASLTASTTSYTAMGLAPGAYLFEVVAVESGIDSLAASCEAEVLAPILGLACSASGSDVTLLWTNGQLYDSIAISRDGVPLAIVSGASSLYQDATVSSGTHTYELIAEDGGSLAAAVSCEVTVVDAITGLSCVSDGSEITLSWTNGATYESIELRRNGALLAVLDGATTSHVDAPAPGVYVYSLTGAAGGGESEPTLCEVTDPGAPSGIDCSATGDDISVSWTNGDAYDSVEIRLNGVLVQSLAGSANSASLNGVAVGVHEVCVTGVIDGDPSASACCSIVVPASISDFDCVAVGNDAHLSWANGENYETVIIERDGSVLAEIPGNLDTFVDTGVAAGTHEYAISGSLGGGTTLSVECNVTILTVIGTVTCSSSAGTVALGFSAAGTYGSIEITRNGTLIATLAGTASIYEDDGLSAGTYEYCVVGVTGDSRTDASCCSVQVPLAPFAVSCETVAGSSVVLNWQNSEAPDDISIERDGEEIARLDGGVNTYTDASVVPGSYVYCVINILGRDRGVEVCCTVTVPAPVLGLTCDSNRGGVDLAWDNQGVYGALQIFRNGVVIAEVSGGAESYTDENPGAGDYDYVVIALAGGSASSAANCAVTVPDPVAGLECENTGFGIELSWFPPPGLDQVQILRNGSLLATVGGNVGFYEDELLIPGEYSYEVVGIDGGEYGEPVGCSIDILAPVEDLTCCASDGAVEICWTNGAAYSSIRVYRDGALVSTLAGAATCFEENEAEGTYEYEIVGIFGPARSTSRTCAVRVAGEILSIACSLTQPTCVGSDALVTWVLTESFDSIDVYRNLVLIATVGGAVEEFVDTDAGAPNSYRVVGVLTDEFCGETASASCFVVDPMEEFVRGNANNDSLVNIADPVYTLNWLFVDGPTPQCLDSADSTDNGSVNIADPVYTLMYLFQDGPPPPAPFPNDGIDETCDELGCDG